MKRSTVTYNSYSFNKTYGWTSTSVPAISWWPLLSKFTIQHKDAGTMRKLTSPSKKFEQFDAFEKLGEKRFLSVQFKDTNLCYPYFRDSSVRRISSEFSRHTIRPNGSTDTTSGCDWLGTSLSRRPFFTACLWNVASSNVHKQYFLCTWKVGDARVEQQHTNCTT